jgi:heterodisulfide reductase subunit C
MHRAFLSEALRRGRVHELSFVLRYKLRTGHLAADATLAPRLLWRGKLKLVPRAGPDMARVRRAIEELKRDGERESA